MTDDINEDTEPEPTDPLPPDVPDGDIGASEDDGSTPAEEENP